MKRIRYFKFFIWIKLFLIFGLSRVKDYLWFYYLVGVKLVWEFILNCRILKFHKGYVIIGKIQKEEFYRIYK